MNRKKILIGAGIVAFGAVGVLAVGATAHDRYKGGPDASYSRHCGEKSMKGRKGHGEHAQRMFDRFDADKDGKVTAAEMDKARADSITRFDANGDGVLQLEEYRGLWLEHMNRRMVDGFQRLDDDGDGKVSDAEMKAPMTRMSRFMDRDGDGVITRDELRPRQKGEHRGKRRGRDDDDDDAGEKGSN